MTQISVDSIKIRHEALTEKVNQAATSNEIIKDVKAFIIEIRAAGAMIPPGNKRELLRSLADAWGNYVYRETGVFPPTDLDAYAGPERHMLTLPPWIASLSRSVQILLLLGIVLVIIVASLLLGSLFGGGSEKAALTAQVAENNAEKTQVAFAVEQTALAQVPVETTSQPDIPTETPTLTQTPTLTPSPTAEQIVLIPVTGGNLRLVELTSLKGGESVSPETTLSGIYENLPSGFSWSIHILLESLSNIGTLYPLEPYFVVPEGESSGQWDLDVRFDIDTGFDVEERFLISLVVAQDDGVRNALKAAVGRGLTELPPKAFSYLGVTTVTRKAYTFISEERLIYASKSKIVTAKLDGSDIRSIPNTEKYWSDQPNISPSGEKIVFVGNLKQSDGKVYYYLVLMDSNGENRKEIKTQTTDIDRPVWSPDSQFIAYSTTGPLFSQLENQASVFNIFLYDIESGTHYQLTGSETYDRYPTWLDEKTLVYNSRTPETRTMGLVILDIETGETKTILDQAVLDEEQPAVSPDGNLIAYSASLSSESDDNSDIYVYDRRNDKITRLTGLRGDDGLDVWPAWSLDGMTIYFQSFNAIGNQATPNIWAIDFDGSEGTNLRQITFGDTAFSPFIGFMKALWLIGE